ncbi:hypothetical protein KC939_00070 [Candidatus Saccharibacteria bacterium]|nr:hypothetical protein [Candidatus Saccharibacteria bacterium]
MMSEVLAKVEKDTSRATAELVYDWMMQDSQQQQLQIPGTEELTEHEIFVKDWKDRLATDNPDKIIVDADDLDEYRYLAAFFGAGFHISQYDEITYQKNENAGEMTRRSWLNIWAEIPKIIPEYSTRSNRMRDEVSERVFVRLVPTTEYHTGTGSYVTTEEDIKRVFQLDYEELRLCREMDFDLLYERKD